MPPEHPQVVDTKARYLTIVLLDSIVAGIFYVVTTLHGGLEGETDLILTTLASFLLWGAFWEVATGTYADVFTRRAATVASFLLTAAAGLLLALQGLSVTQGWIRPDELSLTIGWQMAISLYALGAALISGALEAWLNDRVAYYSPTEPDLAETYRREAVRATVGVAAGYLIAIAVLGALLGTLGIESGGSHAKLNDWFCVVGGGAVLGLCAIAAVTAARMREEYWDLDEHHAHGDLVDFVKTYVQLLVKVRRSFPIMMGLYATAVAVAMVFTFSIWPLLWTGVKQTAGESSTSSFVVLASVFAVVSAGGAILARSLRTKWSLLAIGVDQVRGRHIVASFLANFLPLPLVALLFNYVAAPIVQGIAIVALIVAYRIGMVARQGVLKSALQRAVPDSGHRAVLLSTATALGNLLAVLAVLALGLFLGKEVPVLEGLTFAWVGVPVAAVIVAIGLALRFNHLVEAGPEERGD